MNVNTTEAAESGVRRAAMDRLLGPDASRAEAMLALGAGAVCALVVPTLARARGVEWSTTQLLVAALLAFDLFGGVAVNASEAGRRHYHAPGRRAADHVGFVAAHLLHVAVLAWLFRRGDWAFAGGFGALLLASALVVLAVPAPIRRPVALLACGAAVLAATTAVAPTPGMEWFVPVLFLKLLVSYLLGTVDVPTLPPGRGAESPAS